MLCGGRRRKERVINVQARVWSTLLGQKGSAGGFTRGKSCASFARSQPKPERFFVPLNEATAKRCMALNGELVASQRGGSHSRQVRRGRARKPGRTMRQVIRCPLFKTNCCVAAS